LGFGRDLVEMGLKALKEMYIKKEKVELKLVGKFLEYLDYCYS
jgi:hypothetical protein